MLSGDTASGHAGNGKTYAETKVLPEAAQVVLKIGVKMNTCSHQLPRRFEFREDVTRIALRV
jgi:hypothetical protein